MKKILVGAIALALFIHGTFWYLGKDFDTFPVVPAARATDMGVAFQARNYLERHEAGFEIKPECRTFKVKVPPAAPAKGKGKGKAKAKLPPPPKFVEKTECHNQLHFDVLLAVKKPGERLQIIRANGRTCASETKGFDVMCYTYNGRTNGVNTEFKVNAPQGYCVYAIRRVIGSPMKYHEVVYSPYNDCLNTAEVRKAGREYLDRLVADVYGDLARLQIRSLKNRAAMVHDRVPRDFLHKLALVEHIDEARFASEPLQKLVNEVYTIYGLNQGIAYNYAVSSAQARGIIQIIPSTYEGIRDAYPNAGIEPNFVKGTTNHRNAVRVAVLLLDHDVGMIPDLTVRAWLLDPKQKAKLFDYGCSSYNGGPARAMSLLYKGEDHVDDNPNRENRIYVEKCRAIAKLRPDRS